MNAFELLDDGEDKIQFVPETEMAALLSAPLKLLEAFAPPPKTENAEYRAAILTVEACNLSGAAVLLGGDNGVLPDVFCDWMAAVYGVIDRSAIPATAPKSNEDFLSEIKRLALSSSKSSVSSRATATSSEGSASSAPTDLSVADSDSATLISGYVSESISGDII